MLRGEGELGIKRKEGGKTSPLEFTDASGANNDHGRLHKVNNIKQHVSSVLGVPRLAGHSHVKLRPLQEADRLPNEDVSQGLALHRV